MVKFRGPSSPVLRIPSFSGVSDRFNLVSVVKKNKK